MTVRAQAHASDAQAFIALSAATSANESVPGACDEPWLCSNAGPGKFGAATRLSYGLSGKSATAIRGGR